MEHHLHHHRQQDIKSLLRASACKPLSTALGHVHIYITGVNGIMISEPTTFDSLSPCSRLYQWFHPPDGPEIDQRERDDDDRNHVYQTSGLQIDTHHVSIMPRCCCSDSSHWIRTGNLDQQRIRWVSLLSSSPDVSASVTQESALSKSP